MTTSHWCNGCLTSPWDHGFRILQQIRTQETTPRISNGVHHTFPRGHVSHHFRYNQIHLFRQIHLSKSHKSHKSHKRHQPQKPLLIPKIMRYPGYPTESIPKIDGFISIQYGSTMFNCYNENKVKVTGWPVPLKFGWLKRTPYWVTGNDQSMGSSENRVPIPKVDHSPLKVTSLRHVRHIRHIHSS